MTRHGFPLSCKTVFTATEKFQARTAIFEKVVGYVGLGANAFPFGYYPFGVHRE
jgi:hypothetical protein